MVDTAHAGDVVGLVNPGRFAIGDTLYTGRPVRFPPIPRFPAEHFGIVRLQDIRFKQFEEGVRQLEEEGLMQVAFPRAGRRDPIFGVVGALQFDVIEARLKSEYGITWRVERLPYSAARWVSAPVRAVAGLVTPAQGVLNVVDRQGRTVLLFESDWDLQYCARENPEVELLAVASGVRS